MSAFTIGSLFAGIGGFDLGFERAGFRTKWQVEIDPFATKVLAKNFPHAQRFGDIRTVGAHNLESVDVICGGFPCQDISNAGKRAGIEGARSGLVTEGIRVIRELRPRFVLLENVAALLARGLGEVLGYLAEIGYDAEWEIISAADIGALHLRQRVWILAYPHSRRPHAEQVGVSGCFDTLHVGRDGTEEPVAHPNLAGLEGRVGEGLRERSGEGTARTSSPCAISNTNIKHDDQWRFGAGEVFGEGSESPKLPRGKFPDAEDDAAQREGVRRHESSWEWGSEPNVGRVAHGIPARVDRLRCLGNAVVPQIPELFAQRIRAALEAAQ